MKIKESFSFWGGFVVKERLFVVCVVFGIIPLSLFLPLKWVSGLTMSLVFGHIVTAAVVYGFRLGKAIGRGDEISGRAYGLIERFVFTVAIGFGGSGLAVAVIPWVGAKMAVNWKYKYPKDSSGKEVSGEEHWHYERTSLVGNLVSMFFACIGGFICNGKI